MPQVIKEETDTWRSASTSASPRPLPRPLPLEHSAGARHQAAKAEYEQLMAQLRAVEMAFAGAKTAEQRRGGGPDGRSRSDRRHDRGGAAARVRHGGRGCASRRRRLPARGAQSALPAADMIRDLLCNLVLAPVADVTLARQHVAAVDVARLLRLRAPQRRGVPAGHSGVHVCAVDCIGGERPVAGLADTHRAAPAARPTLQPYRGRMSPRRRSGCSSSSRCSSRIFLRL